MRQVPHVAGHTPIVARVLAAIEALVGRVRADLLKDAAQDFVVQTEGAVRAIVHSSREGEVVASPAFLVLGALLAAEALHETHDAVRERAGGQSVTKLQIERIDGYVGQRRRRGVQRGLLLGRG